MASLLATLIKQNTGPRSQDFQCEEMEFRLDWLLADECAIAVPSEAKPPNTFFAHLNLDNYRLEP